MKVHSHLLNAMIFAAAVGTATACTPKSAEADPAESPANTVHADTLGAIDHPTNPTTPDTATDDDLIVPPREHNPDSCPTCGMG
jgi:hypothetical protein